MKNHKPKLVYFINIDWYFILHWLDRAKAALNKGYEVHIVTCWTDFSNMEKLREQGFICHDIPLDRKTMNPFKDLKTFYCCYKYLKFHNPDIVHCITVKPNLYGGIAARILNLNVILNVCGLGLAFSGKTVRSLVSREIVKILYRFAAGRTLCKVIFENGDDKDTFGQLGIGCKENLHVIPGSGVNTDVYKFVPEEIKDTPIILFAARMLWDKGIADVMAAAEILRKRGISFRLDVAGIIDELSQNALPLKQIVEWHNLQKINWLGERTNMPELLGQADIVVLPSFYGEGVPRVLIEAASVGRAIVTTNVTGCKDIVKDGINGLLVEPESPGNLADALERLLLDQALRHKFGRNGRSIVKKFFEQNKVIRENMKMYNSFVSVPADISPGNLSK